MKNRLLVLTCENKVINVYIILNSEINIDVDFFALFSLNSFKKDTKYFSKKQLQSLKIGNRTLHHTNLLNNKLNTYFELI